MPRSVKVPVGVYVIDDVKSVFSVLSFLFLERF